MEDGMFLVTLVVIENNPVLRITFEGECKDYYLREGQVKLLIKQLIDWLLR